MRERPEIPQTPATKKKKKEKLFESLKHQHRACLSVCRSSFPQHRADGISEGMTGQQEDGCALLISTTALGARFSRSKGGICRGLALEAQEGRKVLLAAWLLDSSFYGKWSQWPHEFQLCTAAESRQAGHKDVLVAFK